MTEKQHSAEKDLLRLIENPGEAELKKAEIGTPVAAEPVKKISLFSFKKKARSAEPKKTLNLRSVMMDRGMILKVLFAATLCAAAYFVVTVVHEYSKAKDTKNIVKFTYISGGKESRAVEAPGDGSSGAAPEPEIGGLRNIFKLDSVKKEEEKKDSGTVSLADYRLVGISIAADPKETYTMVKNVKTNITFFLKKNEKLDGMELVNIMDNRIVFNAKGKDVELR